MRNCFTAALCYNFDQLGGLPRTNSRVTCKGWCAEVLTGCVSVTAETCLSQKPAAESTS